MSLFNFNKKHAAALTTSGQANNSATAVLAELALDTIADGVVIVDGRGVIKYANPAAAEMTGYESPSNIVGLDYQLVIKLENAEGAPIPAEENQLTKAFQRNQAMTTRDYLLVAAKSGRKLAVALTCVPATGLNSDRIITFRDIAKELEEAGAQTEFISTASHEMRTPVASIEGYLGLALNPQTATIDERARQYLEAAHAASQHLGNLFKDLLDVTKLDDGRMRVHLVPVEIVSVVKQIADEHEREMQAKHLKYSFGTTGPVNNGTQLEPLVYAAVDLDFLREIMNNLIENAIKYTPEGGEIWVNARGDGDKVLINVTDTGIGVAADDLAHIFQKFYRVDNSQTRQIGGTGLGLYLVKQRVEAMNGRVWCESSFGDGSTFFVSLPRLTDQDYAKMRLAYENAQAVQAFEMSNAGQGNLRASGTINSGAVAAQAGIAQNEAQQPQMPGTAPTVPAAQPVMTPENPGMPETPTVPANVLPPAPNPLPPAPAAPAPQPVMTNAAPQMPPTQMTPTQMPPMVNQNPLQAPVSNEIMNQNKESV